MKIGIMSMQRVRNYGSYLQAYGLKKTLEALGAEVGFIDYKTEASVFDRTLHIEARSAQCGSRICGGA